MPKTNTKPQSALSLVPNEDEKAPIIMFAPLDECPHLRAERDEIDSLLAEFNI